MRADDRNAKQNGFTVWTNIVVRVSEQMTRDCWAQAEALGRYVDDIAQARTFATYDEARRTYGQRVLALFEQSASGYASLWQTELRSSVRLDDGGQNNQTTVSALVVHDAPPPTVGGSAPATEVTDGSAGTATETGLGLTESARAKAAADAVLDGVRAKAATAAEASTTPSKKRRARKAAPDTKPDAVSASTPRKPHKRPRRPSKDAPPFG